MKTFFDKITGKQQRRIGELITRYQAFSQKVNPIINQIPKRETVVIKHSGQTGDIIYAIPAMQALAGQKKITLLIQINVPIHLANWVAAYGNARINKTGFLMLKTLLEKQPCFASIEIFEDQQVDYDFDLFRELPINLSTGHIPRYFFAAFNVFNDLSLPWMKCVPLPEAKDWIIVSRSFRYRNPAIRYDFIAQYKQIGFIGTDDEYEDMRKNILGIRRIEIADFYSMATWIAGCKLFIGNQSFPFSLAESLKTPRILEVSPHTPNVIPHGENAAEVHFQLHFEKMVEKMVNKKT